MRNINESQKNLLQSPRFAVAVVAVVLLLYFSRVIFTDATYYVSDCQINLHPMKSFMMKSLARGEFPLWNPYPVGGYAFHGSYTPGIFSPLHLLYAVLPFEWAFKYIIVLQHALAAAFMFMFLGVWRLHPLAKATGALAFALSSFLLTQTDYYMPGIVWVPLILYFFHRTLVHLSYSKAILAGVSIALAFCQGDIQTVYGIAFLLIIYTAALRKGVRGDISASSYYRFAWKAYVMAGVTAFLLSAVQFLPAVPTMLESKCWAGSTLEEASEKSLQLHRLQEFVHYARYSDLHDSKELLLHGIEEPFVRRIFLGLASVFLLGFALNRLSKRAIVVACGLALTFALSLGPSGGIFSLLWYALPGFKILQYPEKWLGFFTFFFAAGIALGLDRFQRKEAKNFHNWSGWTPLPIITVIIFLFLWLGSPPTVLPGMPAKSTSTHTAVIHGWLYAAGLAIIMVALAALSVLRIIRVRRLVPIFAAICILELVAFQSWAQKPDLISKRMYTNSHPFGREFLESDPLARIMRNPKDSYIPNESYEKMRKRADFSPRRIEAEIWRRTCSGNIGAEYEIHSVHGLAATDRPEEKIYWHTALSMNNYERAVNCYSAKYILTGRNYRLTNWKPNLQHTAALDNDIALVENLDAMPRAYCVSRSRVRIENGEAALLLFDNAFDPEKEIVLSSEEENLEISGAGPPPSAKLLKHEPRYVRVGIGGSTEPAYLVLTDSYAYGWKARVDGKDAPIYRANLLFRAVPIPAGTREVEFLYSPWIFYLGLIISLVSVLAAPVAYFLLRRRDLNMLNLRHRKPE